MLDLPVSPDSIIENACGIYIKNEVFDSNNVFTFFEKKKHSCLIYGENGSGKTVLSEAFHQLKKQPEIDTKGENVKSKVYLTDAKENNVNPENLDLSNNIFVFNEKFTHENLGIKTDSDGLNSVVLLGEDVELDKEISEKNKKLEELEEEQQDLNKRSKQTEQDLNKLKSALSKKIRTDVNINWGSNRNRINNTLNTNIQITETILKGITDNKSEVSEEIFEIKGKEYELKTKLEIFETLDTISEKKPFDPYKQEITNENLQRINELLSEEIKSDKLSLGKKK